MKRVSSRLSQECAAVRIAAFWRFHQGNIERFGLEADRSLWQCPWAVNWLDCCYDPQAAQQNDGMVAGGCLAARPLRSSECDFLKVSVSLKHASEQIHAFDVEYAAGEKRGKRKGGQSWVRVRMFDRSRRLA